MISAREQAEAALTAYDMPVGSEQRVIEGLVNALRALLAETAPFPSSENLQIVNGWLVERGAHPLDYPAGAAYGAVPYSDAEPLLNLGEILGYPAETAPAENVREVVDSVAQAMCALEVRSKAATLEQVAEGIQRWTRHRYEAECLLRELDDYGLTVTPKTHEPNEQEQSNGWA